MPRPAVKRDRILSLLANTRLSQEDIANKVGAEHGYVYKMNKVHKVRNSKIVRKIQVEYILERARKRRNALIPKIAQLAKKGHPAAFIRKSVGISPSTLRKYLAELRLGYRTQRKGNLVQDRDLVKHFLPYVFLPRSQERAVRLRYLENQSYQQIAQILGLNNRQRAEQLVRDAKAKIEKFAIS